MDPSANRPAATPPDQPLSFVPPGPPPDEPSSPGTLEQEREALRIQAAAVVAQQAALTEEETRLRHRRAALERQKDQLASFLEQRRQELLEMQAEVRRGKAALRAGNEAARQEHERIREGLEKARGQVAETQAQLEQERDRLREFRKRLKRRWHRHWDVQIARMAERERRLAGDAERLWQEAQQCQKERAALVQAQLRFNGEAELGRRRLQDEWQQLGLAQQQWEVTMNTEAARMDRERRELDRQKAALAEADKSLTVRQTQDEERLAWLTAELCGLETRVRNQREILGQQEKELCLRTPGPADEDRPAADVRQPEPPFAEPAIVALAIPLTRRAAAASVIECWPRLTAVLADQRLHLLEQWQRVLKLQQSWQAERAASLAAIDNALLQVEQREKRVASQELALERGMTELQQRQQALSEVRCNLEGWSARLHTREAASEAERAGVLAEVKAREEALAAEARLQGELHKRRLGRRAEEVEALRAARAQWEEMRREYVALWTECQQRHADLARQQRGLAARALALETLRQEVINRSPDPVNLARRLAKLERQQVSRQEAQAKALETERQRVGAEVARLERLAHSLRCGEDELHARRERWVVQELAQGEEGAAAAFAELHRRENLQCLMARNEIQERLVRQLRDEVERIAKLLIDESTPGQRDAA